MPDDVVWRLNRLERPVPWPDEVQAQIWSSMPVGAINEYPNYQEFHQRVADFLAFETDQVVIGQGIEDHIRTLMWLYCEQGDTVMFTAPTCAMFEVYCRAFNLKPGRIASHDPDHQYPLSAMVDPQCGLLDGVKLIILANPGQPVETYYSPKELRPLAAACRDAGTVLAIDEAYHGFGAETALPLVDEYPNFVVLRTFSKALGAAGIRVGAAVGQRGVIQPMEAVRLSGEVAAPCMHVATWLMDRYDDVVIPAINDVCAGRDYFREALRREGLTAYGARANHVLIDLADEETAGAIGRDLADAGLLVKYGYAPPVERHLLVTCWSEPFMREVFEVFMGFYRAHTRDRPAA